MPAATMGLARHLFYKFKGALSKFKVRNKRIATMVCLFSLSWSVQGVPRVRRWNQFMNR